MMKFKNLVLAAALIIGGIGGILANAVANTVMLSIEQDAPVVQTATFPVGASHDLAAEQSKESGNIVTA